MVEVEEVKAACYVEGMPGEREYAFTWWTKVAIPRVNDYMERGGAVAGKWRGRASS